SGEDGREKFDEKSNEVNYRYLERKSDSADGSICYCDEYCVKHSDCCSDYASYSQDCVVDNWGKWSSCIPDDKIRGCGTGVQARRRRISKLPKGAGKDCSPLLEERTCFKQCRNRPSRDTKTAALLLDYKYQKIGERKINFGHRYIHLFSVVICSYCVKYRLGWVNHNCVDSRYKHMLYKGNVICAECQPDAQMHRPDARCAMDLEDGKTGFWKLLGSQSCNGIWTRLSRVDNCKCYKSFNSTDSFLFV
ncbi:unnamed protein product, partial [Enterobius vermicularis]|uniref:SMB domain-containing protein n=1 Tax=Enterobius vermicularis TaxID=51028 RepID=A0A0N4VKC4_ENTVE